MTDEERIREMLHETDDALAGLSLTERTRELHAQALSCKRALEGWQERPPDEATRAALVNRVSKLLVDAKHAAEKSKGPHSQSIKIV